jgi:hypothetical protein
MPASQADPLPYPEKVNQSLVGPFFKLTGLRLPCKNVSEDELKKRYKELKVYEIGFC